MKIEVLAARAESHGHSLRDRLVGWLPRYAPYASRLSWLLNLRDRMPGAARLTEGITGFSAGRSLPRWRSDVFRDGIHGRSNGQPVVLFADTFNRYFERENINAAVAVLAAGGYRVHVASPADGDKRPLCCGRTFLSVGRVDLAREEASRVLEAVAPYLDMGAPVIGLEPSCLYTFRDEVPAFLPGERTARLAAHAMLFEEFLVREVEAGRLDLPLAPLAEKALLHGHCHQKSFASMGSVEKALSLVPDLKVETVDSSCCGMAGAFGYGSETIDVSRAMGELSLLPAVRAAEPDTLIVADGTSCRHQIRDGTSRDAVHVAQVLALSLAVARSSTRHGRP
jgi:Fe-S oxidoreductase